MYRELGFPARFRTPLGSSCGINRAGPSLLLSLRWPWPSRGLCLLCFSCFQRCPRLSFSPHLFPCFCRLPQHWSSSLTKSQSCQEHQWLAFSSIVLYYPAKFLTLPLCWNCQWGQSSMAPVILWNRWPHGSAYHGDILTFGHPLLYRAHKSMLLCFTGSSPGPPSLSFLQNPLVIFFFHE